MTVTLRIYGRWSGMPNGFPEDKTRCVESVWDRYSPGGRQCSRPRGHGEDGLYCKLHDPVAKKARNDASYAKYKAKLDAMTLPYKQAEAMKAALEAISAGHNDARGLADETLKEWFKP